MIVVVTKDKTTLVTDSFDDVAFYYADADIIKLSCYDDSPELLSYISNYINLKELSCSENMLKQLCDKNIKLCKKIDLLTF